jgi:hypothetical protein
MEEQGGFRIKSGMTFFDPERRLLVWVTALFDQEHKTHTSKDQHQQMLSCNYVRYYPAGITYMSHYRWCE